MHRFNQVWAWMVLSLIPLSSFAQGYSIEISVNGFDESEAYLAYYLGDKQYVKDTTAAQNGKFTFAGEESLDGGIYLVVLPPKNNYFEIIVDQDQFFSLQTDTADLVGKMKVKGSQDNEIFYGDMNMLTGQRKRAESLQAELKTLTKGSPEYDKVQAELSGIDGEVKAARQKIIDKHPESLYAKLLSAMKEPEVPPTPLDASGQPIDSLFAFKYYRKHFFDDIDMSDDRLLRTPIMYNKVRTYIDRLTYRQPDSINKSIDYIIDKTRSNDDVFQFFVVHFVNKYAKSKQMGMDAVYVHMVEKYYMTGDAFWTDSATVAKMTERALAISPTLVGRTAPNFSARDTEGRLHSLHDQDAEYLLLYFWDYGCGHCKKVTPKLAEAFKRYKDYNVKLFAVSINGDLEEWKNKLPTYGLDQEGILNVEDHRRLSRFDQMYDITSTPRLFVLTKDKKILAKQISVQSMEEVLSHELGLEPPEKPEEEAENK
jgi:thiol-disulfide isomerase/thioredoxin